MSNQPSEQTRVTQKYKLILDDGSLHSTWEDYDELKWYWMTHKGRLLDRKMKTVIIETCETDDTRSSPAGTTSSGQSAPSLSSQASSLSPTDTKRRRTSSGNSTKGFRA